MEYLQEECDGHTLLIWCHVAELFRKMNPFSIFQDNFIISHVGATVGANLCIISISRIYILQYPVWNIWMLSSELSIRSFFLYFVHSEIVFNNQVAKCLQTLV